MGSNPMVSIASLVLLALFVIFGVQYGVMAIGSTDVGVNDSNLGEYAAQYNAGTNTSITAISLLNQSPLLIGVMTLIVAVLGLAVIIKGKRRY